MDSPSERAGREASGPDLIPLATAAEQLHLSLGTLRQWRYHRKNLRFYRIGGRIMCDQADVDAYIKAGASEPAA